MATLRKTHIMLSVFIYIVVVISRVVLFVVSFLISEYFDIFRLLLNCYNLDNIIDTEVYTVSI